MDVIIIIIFSNVLTYFGGSHEMVRFVTSRFCVTVNSININLNNLGDN